MKALTPSTKIEPHIRMPRGAFAHDAGPHRLAHGGADADRKRAADARAVRTDVVCGLRHLPDQRMRALKEQEPGLGQFKLAAGAQDQLESQLVFQLADLPAQCRLGDAELHRGFRKAACFGNIDKIAERPEIHRDHAKQHNDYRYYILDDAAGTG